MTFEEYDTYDAVGLAGLVATDQVSPAELLDVALARLEAVNPSINAVIRVLDDEARTAIRDGLPQGPLTGVPFLLKDISAAMVGIPTSMGSKLFVNNPAAADSALVQAYRRAGLVIFGKTNTPEFGLAATTEPVLFGPSRNPWDLSRSTGGSSGGSAAAVATSIVPAAHASDGGGSIRIPAACCGIFGLKPSRGRVSMAPAGEGWGSLSVQHAVTRSVRDSAALLDIASVPQPGDPYWIAPPKRPFAEETTRDPGKLRIGFTTAALIWGTPDPQCVRAVKQTAAFCESLGHRVEETILPGNFQMMAMAVNTLVGGSVAALLDREAERRGNPIQETEVERLTWSVYESARLTKGPEYAAAMQTVHAFGRTLASVFEKYDVVMLSTLGRLPVPLGWMDTNAADLSPYGERIYSFMPNTQPFNVAGLPAMSVPLAWSDNGLPIGIQFAAAHAHEAQLFRLAGQLEQAQPWRDRKSPLSAAVN
jgi:Asp-tRNA(Asn)/Glu-tRNA(Gln) amidotransferase A subunit family amidase